MKRVPADEFARHAAEYLEGSETVSVEKDGEVIGRYVPVPNGESSNGVSSGVRSEEERRIRKAEAGKAFERLHPVLQEIYARTGMTEDELVDLLDPKKPFPYDVDSES
jgi:hypothetical protein